MKTLFKNLIDTLAQAAMLEEGVRLDPTSMPACDPLKETIEENFAEIAFAEESDYDAIHKTILYEHRAHCAAA